MWGGREGSKHFGDVERSCACHLRMTSGFPCLRVLVVQIGGPESIFKHPAPKGVMGMEFYEN